MLDGKFQKKRLATKCIWSAYRRYRLKKWLDGKVQERKDGKSIFDEEIIYVLSVMMKKGVNLGNGGNYYVKIQCLNRNYQ